MTAPLRVVGAGAIAGLVFQLLFWDVVPGIAYPLFVATMVALLVAVARAAGTGPHPWAAVPALAAIVLALGPAVRREPLTVTITVLVSLGLLVLFAQTVTHGRWAAFGVRTHLRGAVDVTAASTAGSARVAAAAARDVRAGLAPRARGLIPVVRGMLLAVPLLLFFGLLLGSADPVFASRIGDAVGWLAPVGVGELAGRTMLAVAVGYASAGVATYAVAGGTQPVLVYGPRRPRLGATEAAIVLGSIVAMFALFVAFQVTYLFGGAEQALTAGFTPAEYARRGFAELVAVAVASLVLLLSLARVTARATPSARRLFSLLAAALTVLVLAILASAFGRLLLYEEAFGFTRLRTHVHVLMVWLGVLLVAVAVLEMRDRMRDVPAAMLAVTVGFALTVLGLNVDGLIADRNVARAAQGEQLDLTYATNLSTDAVPALLRARAAASPDLQAHLDGMLACQASRVAEAPSGWQSVNLSTARARRALYRTAPGPCPWSPGY